MESMWLFSKRNLWQWTMIFICFLIGWPARAMAVVDDMFATADSVLEAMVELGPSWLGFSDRRVGTFVRTCYSVGF